MSKTTALSLVRATTILVATAFAVFNASAAMVPFKGSLEGNYTSPPGENPATMSASGNASHLGRFTFSFVAEVSPDATSAFGTVLFVAANGDEIHGTFTGEATLFDLPLIWIEEDVIITGGTGRFSGITGSLIMTRYVDVTDGATAGSFKGTMNK